LRRHAIKLSGQAKRASETDLPKGQKSRRKTRTVSASEQVKQKRGKLQCTNKRKTTTRDFQLGGRKSNKGEKKKKSIKGKTLCSRSVEKIPKGHRVRKRGGIVIGGFRMEKEPTFGGGRKLCHGAHVRSGGGGVMHE